MTIEHWVSEAREDWDRALGGGMLSEARIILGLGPHVKTYGWERLRPCWQRYLQTADRDLADPKTFGELIPGFPPETQETR